MQQPPGALWNASFCQSFHQLGSRAPARAAGPASVCPPPCLASWRNREEEGEMIMVMCMLASPKQSCKITTIAECELPEYSNPLSWRPTHTMHNIIIIFSPTQYTHLLICWNSWSTSSLGQLSEAALCSKMWWRLRVLGSVLTFPLTSKAFLLRLDRSVVLARRRILGMTGVDTLWPASAMLGLLARSINELP